MKRVKKHGKEFKIIPEGKIVRGETVKKILLRELDGLPLRHRRTICAANDRNLIEILSLDDKTSANAYCDDKDTFDENVGMMVCAAKLDKKNHLYLAKDCERTCKVLMECVEFLEKKRKRHLEKAQAIEDDLIKTYGRTPL